MRIHVLAVLTLCAVGAAGAETAPVFTFDRDALGSLPRSTKLVGTNVVGSALTVATTQADGQPRPCLQLSYDFSGERDPQAADPGTKSVGFTTWRRLPDEVRRLRVTLQGDGSGHALLLTVGKIGEWIDFDGPALDWQGWRTFEIDVRGKQRTYRGPDANGRLEDQLTFSGLMILQKPGAPQQGTIRLLSVEAVTAPWGAADDIEVTLGGSAACGVVTPASAGKTTLRLHNPGETATGTLRVAVIPWEGGKPAESEKPWTLAADANTEIALPLPQRCGYYEIQATVVSGDISQWHGLAAVVAPPPPTQRSGRFGYGLFGFFDEPPAPEFARLLTALGADWTSLAMSGQDMWKGDGQLQAEQPDAMLKDLRAGGLECLAYVSPPRWADQADDVVLQKLPPFVDALVGHWPNQMLAWLLPLPSPTRQAVAAARLAADGKPRMLAPVDLTAFTDGSPDVQAIARQQLEATLADKHTKGLWLQSRSLDHLELPPAVQWAGVARAVTAVPMSLPIVFRTNLSTRLPQFNELVPFDAVYARHARELAVCLLRWLSVARLRDRVGFEAGTPMMIGAGLTHNDPLSPKPTAAAFATLTNLFAQATPGQAEERGDYRLQHFATPTGPVIAICPQKSAPQPLTLRLKVTGGAWRIHYLGGRDALPGGASDLPLGADPVYLQGAVEVMP